MLNCIFLFYTHYLKKLIRSVKIKYYKKIFRVSSIDMYFPVFIEDIKNVKVGEGVSINAFVHIWANAPIEIGNNTMIASHVQITSSTHDYSVYPMRSRRMDMPVKIGSNVWIGAGAIILPGVVIGDNSVIGAGSLVNEEVPANVVAFGVPARVVKHISEGSRNTQ